jgi:hypothetical protein
VAVRKHPRVAQCRGVPLKTERLQVHCGSRQQTIPLGASISQGLGSPLLPRGRIWNVHRSSAPGLFAKQCLPSGKWCKSTAFRQPLQADTIARVAQREPAALYPASH